MKERADLCRFWNDAVTSRVVVTCLCLVCQDPQGEECVQEIMISGGRSRVSFFRLCLCLSPSCVSHVPEAPGSVGHQKAKHLQSFSHTWTGCLNRPPLCAVYTPHGVRSRKRKSSRRCVVGQVEREQWGLGWCGGTGRASTP